MANQSEAAILGMGFRPFAALFQAGMHVPLALRITTACTIQALPAFQATISKNAANA